MKPDRNDVLALMEDFADDVERMEISARDSGIDYEREKLAWAWAIYSASICASWLRLPQSDNELVEILKTHAMLASLSAARRLAERSGAKQCDFL